MKKIFSFGGSAALPNVVACKMEDALVLLTPRELVRIQWPQFAISRVGIAADQIRAEADWAEISPLFRMTGAYVGSGRFALFTPGDMMLTVLNLDGKILDKFRAPFHIFGLAAKNSEELLAYGAYNGHLFHRLDRRGAVIGSSLPVPSSHVEAGALDDCYSSCRIIPQTDRIYVLRDCRAGIIDSLDARGEELRRRFTLVDRRRHPISQLAASSVGPTVPDAGSDAKFFQLLWLTFPGQIPRIHSLVSAEEYELAALLSNGQGLAFFSPELTLTKVLRFPVFYPQRAQHLQRILAAFIFGEQIIACAPNGDIWVLKREELAEISPKEIDLEWGAKTGHPLSDHGSPALLATAEMERYSVFWNSLDAGTFTIIMELGQDGRVALARVSSSGKGDPRTASKICRELQRMIFSPVIVRGRPCPATVKVHIMINGHVLDLLQEAGKKLTCLPA